jgi:hypothetical protein
LQASTIGPITAQISSVIIYLMAALGVRSKYHSDPNSLPEQDAQRQLGLVVRHRRFPGFPRWTLTLAQNLRQYPWFSSVFACFLTSGQRLPLGDPQTEPLRPRFDGRLRLEFHKVVSIRGGYGWSAVRFW